MNDKDSELLHDFVRGRLSREQAHEVEVRLSASDALRKELEQVRSYYGALDDLEPVRPSGDFLDKVHERMAARPERAGFIRKIFFPLHIKIPLEIAGVAATFVVIVFLYAPYLGQKPVPQQKMPAEAQPLARVETEVSSSREIPVKPVENKPVKPMPSMKKARGAKAGSSRAKAFAAGLPAAQQAEPAVSSSEPQAAPAGKSAGVEIENAAVPAAQSAAPALAAADAEQVPAAAYEKRAASDREMRIAAASAAPATALADQKMKLEKPDRIERLMEKLSEQNAKTKNSAPVKPEIIVQWHYAPLVSAGSAALEMSEQVRSSGRKEETSVQVPARAEKTEDSTGESGEDTFIAGLLDRYKASAKKSRIADVTIWRIGIAAEYLAPFLEQLRARGKTSVSGEIPRADLQGQVTVILRAEQERR